jgi:hypothetical protein
MGKAVFAFLNCLSILLYKLKTLNKSLDISFVLGNFCPKLSFNIF